jgi:hypothetical protein
VRSSFEATEAEDSLHAHGWKGRTYKAPNRASTVRRLDDSAADTECYRSRGRGVRTVPHVRTKSVPSVRNFNGVTE